MRSGTDVNDVELRSVAIGVGARCVAIHNPALTGKTSRAGVLELAGSATVDGAARYRPADVAGTLADLEVGRPGSSPSLRR